MRKNQKGFAHLGLVLAVIIVIVAIGGVGYYVLSSRKTSNSSPEVAVKTDQKIKTTEKDKQNYDAEGTARDGVLKIPELGIQLKLDPKVLDATYATRSTPVNEAFGCYNYGVSGLCHVFISTQSLEKFGEGCKAKEGHVAFIASFTDPNNSDAVVLAGKNIEEYPNAVKISGRYYAVDNRAIYQSACADEGYSADNYSEANINAREGFQKTTIEKIE